MEGRLRGGYHLSKRAMALLLLQGDSDVESRVRHQEGDGYAAIQEIVSRTRARYSQPLDYVVALRRQREAERILARAVVQGANRRRGFADVLSRVMTNPWTGIPLLLVVLYFGLYQFVGVFGAGIVVNFLESTVFGNWVTPWVNRAAAYVFPWQLLRDLFAGDYGMITLGVRYAIAIILPIVGTFFIAFSIIEDSGYLPRLALLVDRVFKLIGLTGRAVIPMVLGFGCDTMATIVTRTQETKRERVIATLLLALAIPCSAQLGVIMAILSGNPRALLVWALVVALVFMLVGFLAARVIPGEKASFYMEVPPLRMPKVSNVLAKTFARMRWYFLEVFPIFILASVLIWAGKATGVFDIITRGLEPVVGFVGLPPQTAVAFLFGFFRRDYGAAGLFDLHAAGTLTGIPLVVAAVTLTLFLPCVAQFGVMLKERGVKTALAIALFIFPFAFLVGFALNWLLTSLGVKL
ncbi:MAG: ferrous iron transporter B [Chloroflexota bacterium]